MSAVSASLTRCLLVAVIATLGAGFLLGWLLADLATTITGPVPRTFEARLVLGCEVAAVLATGWLWLLVGLVVRDAARGRAVPTRGVPAAVRRTVLAACGAGLVGGLVVAPAQATPSPSPLAGLPLPDRPTGRTTSPPADPPRASRSAADLPDRRTGSVTVGPGDSLWALAAADLPDGASLAEVDERWRAIHAANREVIGDDPDLIHPGQPLRLPPLPPSAT